MEVLGSWKFFLFLYLYRVFIYEKNSLKGSFTKNAFQNDVQNSTTCVGSAGLQFSLSV